MRSQGKEGVKGFMRKTQGKLIGSKGSDTTREGGKKGGEKGDPHLRGVQFVFADNLDRNFAAGLAFNRLVHIGESAVAHLFDKFVFLQALCKRSLN